MRAASPVIVPVNPSMRTDSCDRFQSDRESKRYVNKVINKYQQAGGN
jgi:hypothetical protein